MNSFLGISFIIFIHNHIDAMKVKLVPVKDMPVEDCDGYPPETSFHKFFDISNLIFNRIEEDVIVANGDIIYKGRLFDTDITEATIQLFIYQFGKWLPTPYTSFVEDVCKAAFGPNANAMWKNAIKKVKGKKQCPFEAGDKFIINQTILDDCYDLTIMRDANDFDGLYKAIVTVKNNKKPALFCYQSIFEIHNCS